MSLVYSPGITGVRQAGCSKWHPSKAAGSSVTEAYPWGTSQGDGRPRTPLGDIFSILLGFFLAEEERSIHSSNGDGDEFNRQQQSAHDSIGCRWA
jgi:hypothetical protein